MQRDRIDNNVWPPENFLIEFLRHKDSIEINVDGSVEPVDYEYRVPVGRQAVLTQINIILTHTTIDPSTFGALSELKEGIRLSFRDANDAVLRDLTGGRAIVRNADWRILAEVKTQSRLGSMGSDAISVQWNFPRTNAAAAVLKSGECLQLRVQDDLSSLDLFRCMVQGLLVTVTKKFI